MPMIDPATEARIHAEPEEVFVEALKGIWQNIADRHGHIQANVMLQVTSAMLDHLAGTRRGITAKTWQRPVTQLKAEPDSWTTVLYRPHNKAHWLPQAVA